MDATLMLRVRTAMRTIWMLKTLVLAVALVIPQGPAVAASVLDVYPNSQIVSIGSSSEFALRISGLGAGVAPSLSLFDINVAYDPAILGISGVTFGDPVLGDQLDLFGFGSLIVSDDSVPGDLWLSEVSYDLPWDLEDLQADAFTLATVQIIALGAGTSPVDLTLNALGDSIGGPLEAEVVNGSVEVIEAIPEPATLWLAAAGLALLAARRRLVS